MLQELTRFGLKPNHKVLDVGCGNGKVAVRLTRFLKDGGSYEGFDVVATGVNWCKEHITPQHPNFRFQHADVYNKTYNPQGKYQSCEYRFPYDDGTFDFVLLGSVFTHMLPKEVEHYFGEIARVLKRQGICYISYYLLNPTSRKGIDAGWSFFPFPFTYGSETCRIGNTERPEDVVAYDEGYVKGLYEKHGLRIEEPIIHGKWWWGVPHDQDLVKATKA